MEKQHKQLRSSAKGLMPLLQIGKQGVLPGTIVLVDRELTARHLIKIKILPSAPACATKDERKVVAQQLASATRAKVIDQIGNVIVLYRA